MTRVHDLKCLSSYFAAIRSGEKTFEVRRDDRGFQRGDVLLLREYVKAFDILRPTGEVEEREITWVLTGGQFGIEPGFVVLALGPVIPTTGGSSDGR